RGRRRRRLPVDVGGLRQPGGRVGDRPAAARGAALPDAGGDPGLGPAPVRPGPPGGSGRLPRCPGPGDARTERRARPPPVLPRRPPGPARRRLRRSRVDTVVKEPDPVLARRARIARVARVGKRAGYAALVVAVASFVVAAATDFPALAVDLSVAALVVAIVVLPVPIVLGYGIRAAEREEREERQRRYG